MTRDKGSSFICQISLYAENRRVREWEEKHERLKREKEKDRERERKNE